MFHWLHHVFNPHCADCYAENLEHQQRLAYERNENSKCESCETLREQLRISNHEKEVLLLNLLNKSNDNQAMEQRVPSMVSKPAMVPWNVRRQMLEQEDRAKAVAMRNAAKPNSEPVQSIEEIEKELLGGDNAIRPSDEEVQEG